MLELIRYFLVLLLVLFLMLLLLLWIAEVLLPDWNTGCLADQLGLWAEDKCTQIHDNIRMITASTFLCLDATVNYYIMHSQGNFKGIQWAPQGNNQTTFLTFLLCI